MHGKIVDARLNAALMQAVADGVAAGDVDVLECDGEDVVRDESAVAREWDDDFFDLAQAFDVLRADFRAAGKVGAEFGKLHERERGADVVHAVVVAVSDDVVQGGVALGSVVGGGRHSVRTHQPGQWPQSCRVCARGNR